MSSSSSVSVGRGSKRGRESDVADAVASSKKQKKNACIWCRQDFSIENPIISHRSKSETLPRSKGVGPCDICRATKRTQAPEKKDAQITALLKDDEAHKQWMVGFWCHVAKKNKTPVEDVEGFVAPESRDGPLTTISRRSSKDLVSEIVVNHFWPADVLTQTLGIVAEQEDLVQSIDAFGTACEGVNRKPADDPEVLPRRVRQIRQEIRQGASKEVEIDRSDDHIREGQGQDAWQAAQQSVEFDAGEEDGNTDDDFAMLHVVSKKPAVADDEDDDAGVSGALGSGASHLKRKATAKGAGGRHVGGSPSPNVKAAASQAKRKTSWVERQKATREMQAATKLVGSLDLMFTGWQNDGTSIALSECTGLEKKMSQRLGEGVRWVYLGEDLIEGDQASLDKRSQLLTALRQGETKLYCISAVMRSCGATEEKDPLSYSPGSFTRALQDADEVGLKVSESICEKYLGRVAACSLRDTWSVIANIWGDYVRELDLLSIPSLREACVTMLPGDIFNEWVALVSVADDKVASFSSGFRVVQKLLPASQWFTVQEIVLNETFTEVAQWSRSDVFTRHAKTIPIAVDDGEEQDGQLHTEADAEAEMQKQWRLLVAQFHYRIGEVFFKTAGKVTFPPQSENDGLQNLIRNYATIANDSSTIEEANTAFEELSKPSFFRKVWKPGGLLETFVTMAEDNLNNRVLADRALRRTTHLKALLESPPVQQMVDKILGPEVVGLRFIRTLEPLRDIVIEHKKICSVVSEDRLKSSADFTACKAKLESLIGTLEQVSKTKFSKEFGKALSLIVDAEDGKLTQALSTCAVSCLALGKAVQSESLAPFVPSAEMSKQADALMSQRSGLVDRFAVGLQHCSKLKVSKDAVGIGSKDFVALHSGIHAFSKALAISVDFDALMLEPCSATLIAVKSRLHKYLFEHYASCLSLWHSCANSISAAKLLDTTILELLTGKADIEKLGEAIFHSCTASTTGILPNEVGSISETWRAAAYSVLTSDNAFKFDSRRSVVMHSGIEECKTASVGVSPATCLCLHAFMRLQLTIGKVKGICKCGSGSVKLTSLAEVPELPVLRPVIKSFLDAITSLLQPTCKDGVASVVQRTISILKHSAVEELNIRLTHQVSELSESFTAVADEGIEKLVEDAEVVSDEVRTKCLLVVNGKKAQAFKKVYKNTYSLKNVPASVLKKLEASLGTLDAGDKMKEYMDSEEFEQMEKLYAMLAIAQCSFRKLKPGESRSVVQGLAQSCEAVANARDRGQLPLKWAMLLGDKNS